MMWAEMCEPVVSSFLVSSSSPNARGGPGKALQGPSSLFGRDAALFTPPSGGAVRVLLVGGGYSAATTLLALVEAGRRHPEGEMRIEW